MRKHLVKCECAPLREKLTATIKAWMDRDDRHLVVYDEHGRECNFMELHIRCVSCGFQGRKLSEHTYRELQAIDPSLCFLLQRALADYKGL